MVENLLQCLHHSELKELMQWVLSPKVEGIALELSHIQILHLNLRVGYHQNLSYILTEFERLKTNEAYQEKIDWQTNRMFSKLNYVFHTDAVKTYIVPTPTEAQKKFVCKSRKYEILY